MNSHLFSIKGEKCAFVLGFIIPLPMLLIIGRREAGLALVYLTFFLVLCQEGMFGIALLAGLCAVIYFVVDIRFDEVFIVDTPTPLGELVVLLLILLFAGGMIWMYPKEWKPTWNIIGESLIILLITCLMSEYGMHLNLVWVQWGFCAPMIDYLLYLALRERQRSYFLIALFVIGFIGLLYSSNYTLDNILEPHRRIRIKAVLGIEEDPAGTGYSISQPKIAIGSGGLTGKGFLDGIQTKLKYVSEQDTGFISCTVGEEQGFVGSAAVLLAFLILILRLIVLSERRAFIFVHVYGYPVINIFLFYPFVNVGMVLGLIPVTGIPLLFFSYGGSSLWGFTILLFIFLRLDAGRGRRLQPILLTFQPKYRRH